MKTRIRVAATIFAAFLGACGGTAQTATVSTTAPAPAVSAAAPAASPTRPPIAVSDAWARAGLAAMAAPAAPAMPGATVAGTAGNSGVFMTIRNSGPSADRLVKAMSDGAGATELHTTTMVNGVMQMRPVEAIDIPAGGVVTLQPGGFHVMLIGLKRDLKVGDSVKLTLVFEKAGSLTIDVPVRAG